MKTFHIKGLVWIDCEEKIDYDNTIVAAARIPGHVYQIKRHPGTRLTVNVGPEFDGGLSFGVDSYVDSIEEGKRRIEEHWESMLEPFIVEDDS